jgi:glutamyl-tRNA reductase
MKFHKRFVALGAVIDNRESSSTPGTSSTSSSSSSSPPRPDVRLRPAGVSDAVVDSHKALEALARLGGNPYESERKSSILTIGLSIHNCPVEIREKMAVPAEAWNDAVSALTALPHIEEAGILSTCNRMEIYVVALSHERGLREVEEWMVKHSGVELDALRENLFVLKDREATAHLLRVSGGLDSVVMGEGQILAQVRTVVQMGENVPAFGRHLTGLFKAAITAGKRVRSETSIASGAVSVSSAAAELVQMKLPSESFEGVKVLIVGAGTMSKLLVKHLASKRCTEMTIVNRTRPRAEALAEEFPEVNMKIELMDQFLQLAGEHDVIFTASSAVEPIICKADLASMAQCGELVGGKRRLVDIAVPRNVAADCAQDSNTLIYNVDDLKELAEINKGKREAAAKEAENLLLEEQRNFEAWRDSLETVPTIKRLRQKAETIRAAELDKALLKLGDGLTNKQKKAVEELSRGIVNKLLHGPMAALRSDGSDPLEVTLTLVNMHALERMFDLRNVSDD